MPPAGPSTHTSHLLSSAAPDLEPASFSRTHTRSRSPQYSGPTLRYSSLRTPSRGAAPRSAANTRASDTLKALDLGAVETLIVFENLEITRYVLKDSEGAEIVIHTTKQQETGDRSQFMDKATGQEMDIVSQESFLEWVAEHYKDFGATLEFVSDRSTEGNQFVKGFGGIGGLLRYKVNFEQLADFDDDDDDYYDD
ncbi:eukaryotic peptide chain release factor subunit 1 [Verticillium alfalfae VaMs.102]|uniref:Eukaryotic peptide chain release factor subunit 1 n=1 Tax=Verticillium alfalfae (strain VaMs.102 / ATCC MYA-4576 / FGSC 10136) TaxID=526221 RepID=C9SPR9_VERA1|nr:eukaryotic peptide chain release factor subunit 1 [Verticillium alfalfae VaMs.102]EEY20784.1 eukaryotic peptide chain release factor subunit 1 [Verticillium alfalfae VaMs.102]